MCTNTQKRILIFCHAYWFRMVLAACLYGRKEVLINMFFSDNHFAHLCFGSNCILMVSFPLLAASPLTSNRRNMCMFSLYWLCLSCSSLSHACTHKHTQIHTKVLWSGKGLQLCTFPTSFTLHNTNNTGQTRTIKTHKGERSGWKGIICSNRAALNNMLICSHAAPYS